MKIGIIGAGNIGSTVARKLAASGHAVKIAHAGGPESLQELATKIGATAVAAGDAVKDVDVIVLSVPLSACADLAGVFQEAPSNVIVVDTSNYYPFRDSAIAEIDGGKPESGWVGERIGRPVVKTWNAALAETLANRGRPAGQPGRLALPVAGDDTGAKAIVMKLVDETGFDPVDAGEVAQSWRQQPGTPAYCTELAAAGLATALQSADKSRAPVNRERLIKEFMQGKEMTHDEIVARNRAGTA